MNADHTLNEELYATIGARKMSAHLLGATSRTVRSRASASSRAPRRPSNPSMEPYRKVPVSWNVALSIVLLAVFIALAATGKLYLPLYTVFIALGVDALLVVCLCGVWLAPFSVVYFHGQVLNELLYGYVIDARGSRPPVGLLSYHTILGQCWYEAYSMFSDTKLGHHVVNTKGRFLDPNKQWTVRFISRTNQGIAFGLVGPKKLFADPMHVQYLACIYDISIEVAGTCCLPWNSRASAPRLCGSYNVDRYDDERESVLLRHIPHPEAARALERHCFLGAGEFAMRMILPEAYHTTSLAAHFPVAAVFVPKPDDIVRDGRDAGRRQVGSQARERRQARRRYATVNTSAPPSSMMCGLGTIGGWGGMRA
ncbi:hypothetical protein C8R46DRAFT_1355875 [Mycena filopes]|nr:hypothetical protein C8R46DRAFT_1355875 [Mycena filopes]